MDTAARVCSDCGLTAKHSEEPLLCCSHCRSAFYHDGSCQANHHKREHSAVCSFIAKKKDKSKCRSRGLEVIESISQKDTSSSRFMVISSQEFQKGQMVLIEPPAMFFDENKSNGVHEMFQAFLCLSKAEQDSILKLLPVSASSTLPDTPQVLLEAYATFQARNERAAQYLTIEIAQKMFVILNENALVFQLSTTPTYFTGLFLTASKIGHSCAPNVSLRVEDGLASCRCDKRIRSLDQVSISFMTSVYEHPRLERQRWLLENKGFECQCSRCLAFDECQPVYCSQCAMGIMFHHGKSNQWVCTSCKAGVGCYDDLQIQLQLDKMECFAIEMDAIRDLIGRSEEDEDNESALEDDLALALSNLLSLTKSFETIHHMSWLHMTACRLLSEVASEMARRIVMQNSYSETGSAYARLDPRVKELFRLSALVMLHRVSWLQVNVAVVQGVISLEKAAHQKPILEPLQFNENGVPFSQIYHAVRLICDIPEPCTVSQYLQEIFVAGQDLILAGDIALAYRLYKRMGPSLLKCAQLSKEDRHCIELFLDSKGQENPFEDMSMD